jgi:hypothetical protein
MAKSYRYLSSTLLERRRAGHFHAHKRPLARSAYRLSLKVGLLRTSNVPSLHPGSRRLLTNFSPSLLER